VKEKFRVCPESKILDGVAWLAASHGATLEDEKKPKKL
jgi:hypothetical protein